MNIKRFSEEFKNILWLLLIVYQFNSFIKQKFPNQYYIIFDDWSLSAQIEFKNDYRGFIQKILKILSGYISKFQT